MFYEYDGTLSKDESGYLFNFQDRREETTFLEAKVNLTGLVSIKSNCDKYMMCGMPLYDYRYVQNRLQSKWLPRSEPIVPPGLTTLEVLNKTRLNPTTVRFEFNLTGPSHMSVFIKPYEDVQISNWSFLRSYLDSPPAAPLAYHIYFTYGIDSSPLNFFLEFTVIHCVDTFIFQLNPYIFNDLTFRKRMAISKFQCSSWQCRDIILAMRATPKVRSSHIPFHHMQFWPNGQHYTNDTYFRNVEIFDK